MMTSSHLHTDSTTGHTIASPPSKADIVAALKQLAPQLKEKGVAGLSLFGSVLHDKAVPGSDVDLLLDPLKNARMSLIDRLVLRDMIAQAIGHPVDLIPRNALIEDIRDRVEKEAEPIAI